MILNCVYEKKIRLSWSNIQFANQWSLSKIIYSYKILDSYFIVRSILTFSCRFCFCCLLFTNILQTQNAVQYIFYSLNLVLQKNRDSELNFFVCYNLLRTSESSMWNKINLYKVLLVISANYEWIGSSISRFLLLCFEIHM